MTMTELQAKLGEQIALLTDSGITYVDKKEIANVAQTISSLAKQMINNADVVLRTEKLVAEGVLKDSAIQQMIR